jgi:hypothetical protein
MAVAGDNGHEGLCEQMIFLFFLFFVIAGKDCSLNAVVFSFAMVGACLDGERVLFSGHVVGLKFGSPEKFNISRKKINGSNYFLGAITKGSLGSVCFDVKILQKLFFNKMFFI